MYLYKDMPNDQTTQGCCSCPQSAILPAAGTPLPSRTAWLRAGRRVYNPIFSPESPNITSFRPPLPPSGTPRRKQPKKKQLQGGTERLWGTGGCGERGRAEAEQLPPRAALWSRGSPRPFSPRLLPSGRTRSGAGSGWLWLRRSLQAAQQDAAAPAAAPQTKPPKKRRWRGRAAMAEGGRQRGRMEALRCSALCQPAMAASPQYNNVLIKGKTGFPRKLKK